MPSGSLTLLESVKYGSDLVKKGVVETIVRESPVLESLPMLTIVGNALQHTVEETLPSVAFRKVNASYTRSHGTDSKVFWGVAILGGEVFVDNFIVNTMGNQISAKARQFSKVAKAAALTFDRYFFDGAGTADDFKGVNTLIDEGFGQVYVPNTNGGALTLDFLDYSHDLLRTGSADALLTNRTLRRKVTNLARTSVTGVALIDVGDDKFGRQVTQWNGIPIRLLGDDEAGNQILAFDETCGSSSVTSSIYFVRYGEDHVTGLFGGGGHFEVQDFGETQAAPGHLGRIEFYPGLAIFDKYAIVRLKGLTNA